MTVKKRSHSSRHIAFILILSAALMVGLSLNAWMYIQGQDIEQRAADEQAELPATIDALIASIHKRQATVAAELTAQSLANPDDCALPHKHDDPTRIDVLVNKKHCIQPRDFTPSDLVTVYGATLTREAAAQFAALYEAARADNQPIRVTSSYRSYAEQVTTYDYWIAMSGQTEADTYSARPGYSEHQTGLAFDIAADGCVLDCFGSTSQYQWMQTHATDYGFIQRYYAGAEATTGYSAEEWHYRYVGVDTAKDMQSKGIKTLEEYWRLAGGGY